MNSDDLAGASNEGPTVSVSFDADALWQPRISSGRAAAYRYGTDWEEVPVVDEHAAVQP